MNAYFPIFASHIYKTACHVVSTAIWKLMVETCVYKTQLEKNMTKQHVSECSDLGTFKSMPQMLHNRYGTANEIVLAQVVRPARLLSPVCNAMRATSY